MQRVDNHGWKFVHGWNNKSNGESKMNTQVIFAGRLPLTLAPSSPSRPARRALAFATLAFCLAASRAPAVQTIYTNLNGGKWETPTNWLIGAPGPGQSIFISNSPSKTVIIDAATASSAPVSLLISDLTLLAANPATTNTLLLSNASTNSPLTVTNLLTLGLGGALTLTNSALSLPGPAPIYSGSTQAALSVDGPLSLNNTSLVTALAGRILVDNFAGSSNGPITVNSGSTLRARFMVLGNAPGASSLVTLNGGTLDCSASTNFLAIGSASNASAAVTVNGGLLQTAPAGETSVGGQFSRIFPYFSGGGPGGSGTLTVNGGEAQLGWTYVGATKPGTLLIQGGTVVIAQSLQVGLQTNGTVCVTGGQLLATNATYTGQDWVSVLVGNLGPGTLIVGSNGMVVASYLNVGYSGGQTSTFALDGGTVQVRSSLVVGNCPGGTVGNVTLNGGGLFVQNAGHTAVFDVRNGTVVLNPGATLTVDTLVLTNSCGHFNFNGGTLIFNQLVLPPNAPPLRLQTGSSPRASALTLSWPSIYVGYYLQQNADLSPQNWTPVYQTPLDDGTNRTITISPLNSRMFYRVCKPGN